MDDTTSNGNGVLSLSTLEEASGGDRELMEELAQLYSTDAEDQFGALREAVAQGDIERIGRVAHGLKGSSASIGACEAADAFRHIENMGREGTLDGIETRIEDARLAFVEVPPEDSGGSPPVP